MDEQSFGKMRENVLTCTPVSWLRSKSSVAVMWVTPPEELRREEEEDEAMAVSSSLVFLSSWA
jgi:hypothetical protein